VNPILFDVFGWSIHSYSILLIAGILAAILVIRQNAKLSSITPDQATDLIILMAIAGIIGSRIMYVIQFWENYQDQWARIFFVWEGGLVYYGGFIFSVVLLAIVARVKDWSYLESLDLLMPSLAIGQAFGRVGCFFNGCCFGKASALPWAVQFPFLTSRVHPTQLYESLFLVLLFLLLIRVYRRAYWKGETLCFYLSFYGAGRFVIEYMRGDHMHYYLNHTVSQWVSVGLMIAGLLGFLLLRKRFPYAR